MSKTRFWSSALASLSVVAVSGAIALGGSGRAWAYTEPSSPFGSQVCSDYGQASNGSYNNVFACNGPHVGAVSFAGSGGARITSDTVGFQCVELADRYLYAENGWAVEYTNGADIARVYGAAHGVTPVQSGNSAGLIPRPGDVISFSVLSNFTDDGGYYPGHVAIVVATTSSSVTILSENWGGRSAVSTLTLNGTRVQSISTYDGGGVIVNTPYIEWLPLTAPAPPPPSYGPYYVVGTGGYGLNERSQPTSGSALLGNLPNGTKLYLACQAVGAAYGTGGSPSTDSIWDRLTNGAYVADYWVSTPYVGRFSPGIAVC